MGKRSLVVVNLYSTKLPLDTALKTYDQTVESRNSDLLHTPTALASHPDTSTVLSSLHVS